MKSLRKFKAIIVEDEFFVANHIKMILEKNGVDVLGIFHDGEALIESEHLEIDFAFLDIHIEGSIDGVEIAEFLNKKNVPFAFITANKEAEILTRAAKTFPTQYITKPFRDADIAVAISLLVARKNRFLTIRRNNSTEKVPFDDICFFKSENVYIEIHTTKGYYTERMLLKELLEILPPNFVRVHRSYVVNREKIQSKSSKEVVVNSQVIPVSRTYRNFL